MSDLYDQGAGRSPAVSGRIAQYDSGTVNEDISIGSDETNTISLNTTYLQAVVAVNVSLAPYAVGVGNIPDGKVTIMIDETPIATYALPKSDAWASNINDIIPFYKELYGTGHTLKIITGAGSGVSYNILYRVLVYTRAL